MSDCMASIDGWCETHSTGAGPAWCVDSLRVALRRARFHERELYQRATDAEAKVARVEALTEMDAWGLGAELRAALDGEGGAA